MNGLAATRAVGGFRRNGLEAARTEIDSQVLAAGLHGVFHLCRPIYHRVEGAIILPLVIIEECDFSQRSS
jgi:hypothetical protein